MKLLQTTATLPTTRCTKRRLTHALDTQSSPPAGNPSNQHTTTHAHNSSNEKRPSDYAPFPRKRTAQQHHQHTYTRHNILLTGPTAQQQRLAFSLTISRILFPLLIEWVVSTESPLTIYELLSLVFSHISFFCFLGVGGVQDRTDKGNGNAG